MSEIKGIDQIFPKKPEDTSAAGSLKLWVFAGLVAALAAGYAILPLGKPSVEPPVGSNPVVSAPVAAHTRVSKPVVETVVKKSTPAPVVVEDVKTVRKQEAKRQQQQQKAEIAQSRAPEVTAASKVLGGRSCDCDTAELNLPAQCPDASCRQCKASCGIPGN